MYNEKYKIFSTLKPLGVKTTIQKMANKIVKVLVEDTGYENEKLEDKKNNLNQKIITLFSDEQVEKIIHPIYDMFLEKVKSDPGFQAFLEKRLFSATSEKEYNFIRTIFYRGHIKVTECTLNKLLSYDEVFANSIIWYTLNDIENTLKFLRKNASTKDIRETADRRLQWFFSKSLALDYLVEEKD